MQVVCVCVHVLPGEKGPDGAPKSLLLKPGQSGLRPPGFSSLPARLTAFGFARSSSVSSASSNQSNDSDRCQLSQGESPAAGQLTLRFATWLRVNAWF